MPKYARVTFVRNRHGFTTAERTPFAPSSISHVLEQIAADTIVEIYGATSVTLADDIAPLYQVERQEKFGRHVIRLARGFDAVGEIAGIV